jgi:hypothetical protein
MAGNVSVNFRFELGPNALQRVPMGPTGRGGGTVVGLRGLAEHDVVLAGDGGQPPELTICRVEAHVDRNTGRRGLRLRAAAASGGGPDKVVPLDDPRVGDVRRLTVSVEIGPLGRFMEKTVFENLAFDRAHSDALSRVLADRPDHASPFVSAPVVLELAPAVGLGGVSLAAAMLAQTSLAGESQASGSGHGDSIAAALQRVFTGQGVSTSARSFRADLTGGCDGARPRARHYRGRRKGRPSGLHALARCADVAIVAVPGVTRDYPRKTRGLRVVRHLIAHCEEQRYRMGIVDPGKGMSPADVLGMRSLLESSRAVLYYPWIRCRDPLNGKEISLPPSACLAGIWARNDSERGVHEAPANLSIRSAEGLELRLDAAEDESLNSAGVNCLRFFEGRGYRVFGARTLSADPEWKYVSVRRQVLYLERSMDEGTRWAASEINDETLWARLRDSVARFLADEWRLGRLQGAKPDDAFFVRCDRSTMTESDIERGRLVCLVGVAPLKPAEFLILRIQHQTRPPSA